MQQGSPKSSHESKAAFKSNQKPAILEFARISKSQVFPSLIAVGKLGFDEFRAETQRKKSVGVFHLPARA
jgi:hypothetical protein